MTRARLLASSLAALALASCGAPQVPPQQNYGTIRGRVYDAGANTGIGGVTVVAFAIRTAVTASDGTYTIANVPLGEYDVQLQQLPRGYTGKTDYGGSIAAGETITVDFPLTKS